VGDELVDFVERARIEEEVDPLAGGELAGVVLPFQALVTAAACGAALEVVKMIDRIQ
jgi:hypothetical protein